MRTKRGLHHSSSAAGRLRRRPGFARDRCNVDRPCERRTHRAQAECRSPRQKRAARREALETCLSTARACYPADAFRRWPMDSRLVIHRRKQAFALAFTPMGHRHCTPNVRRMRISGPKCTPVSITPRTYELAGFDSASSSYPADRRLKNSDEIAVAARIPIIGWAGRRYRTLPMNRLCNTLK